MAGEKTQSTTNFFLLLGLHPADPWDEKKFELALEAKRSEWARKSNMVGTVAMEAKRNLALYSEIQRVMKDPAERALQAAAAQQEAEAGRQGRLAQFESQVEIATKKGFLEQAELEKFLADFKGVLSESEIRSHIKVPIHAPGSQGSGAQQLDPTTLKAINDGLHFLQKSDLYTLLGMQDMTSNEALSRAAQALYEDTQRRQPKTPEVTATSTLAGHARVIFKTDEMRRKYNESRRQSKLTALLEEFEETVNRGSSGKQKGLYGGQVAHFLERATRDGWSQDEARTRLQEYANLRHWFLEMPTLTLEADLQRCGNCKALNPKNREYCKECNEALRIHCPNCGQQVPANEVGCGKCGFPVGNRYEVDKLLADFRDLLARQQLEAADRQLKEAEELWSPRKADPRLQQIQACRAEIQRLDQSHRESAKKLKDLLDARKFFAARAYLSQPQARPLPDCASSIQTINEAIAQAQALLRQARALQNADQKIDLCFQALRSCADYQEAHDLLSTLPPSPPRNLQASESGATVRLQWEASPTRNVGYNVVRKSGSQPASVQDGLLLATVNGRIYEDTNPEIGVPTFYAVFATLANISSLDAALLQQPVLLIRDVAQIQTRVDSQLVEISWQVPPHVINILVMRKEQEPSISPNDGQRLTLLDTQHLLDPTAENEHLYFYTIYCQFKDYAGRLVTSPGVSVKASPAAPPAIISALDIASVKTAYGYEVQLRWPAPAQGQAAILKSAGPLKLREREAVAVSELAQHGNVLAERPDACTDRWEQTGAAYYTPLVIVQETAYIGPSQRFAVIDDISDLRYQNIGSGIRLNWTWPANCQEVVVSYDYHGWPPTNSATATSQKVTRIEYEHRGYYDIKGAPNQDHYIVIAATITQGNDRIVGSGVRVHARLASKMILSYEIKVPRTLFGPKKRLLQITARSAGILPTLLVMSKQGRLPLRKEEGEIFYRVEGPFAIETVLEFELPERAFAPRTFGKLYLENDTLYEAVTIHHPSEEKLRLA